MPPRPCPLPCSDAHEPTDRSLPPPDHQQDPARLRDRRRPRNLVTRTRHCATILTTLIVSTAALTACTRAEAEPPVAQTPSEASPTTAVTSTPGPAKVRITAPPSDPELHRALRQYGRFEAALMAQIHTGGSPDSRRMVEAVTHPEGDAREFGRILAEQDSRDGPMEITGTLILTEHLTTYRGSDEIEIHACWSPEELVSSVIDVSKYQNTVVTMVRHLGGWVVGSYKTAMDQTCR